MRIAVVSTDGRNVDEHFGRAERFLVYDLLPGGPEFIEERMSPPLSVGDRNHSFDAERFQATADVLADCRQVYVTRIGEKPTEELVSRGIQPKVYQGPIAQIKG